MWWFLGALSISASVVLFGLLLSRRNPERKLKASYNAYEEDYYKRMYEDALAYAERIYQQK